MFFGRVLVQLPLNLICLLERHDLFVAYGVVGHEDDVSIQREKDVGRERCEAQEHGLFRLVNLPVGVAVEG